MCKDKMLMCKDKNKILYVVLVVVRRRLLCVVEFAELIVGLETAVVVLLFLSCLFWFLIDSLR